MSNNKSYAEEFPYSWTLRNSIEMEISPKTYSESEIIDSFLELAVKREKENKFNEIITKDIYFYILYDIITSTILKKK